MGSKSAGAGPGRRTGEEVAADSFWLLIGLLAATCCARQLFSHDRVTQKRRNFFAKPDDLNETVILDPSSAGTRRKPILLAAICNHGPAQGREFCKLPRSRLSQRKRLSSFRK